MIGKNGVSLLIGHNGVQDKTALNPANETVARGIYDATTLSTVDAELATANIKNGITIFGFAGDADVHDISDATAIEAEVITGETFYAASGGIRTGTMPIEALNPALNEYPAGYHAGAASLTAVDAQLVTGSIKYGITIFGVAGHTNVRDSSDATATATRVRSGYTFYAGGGARKTGTLATVAITAANDSYPAGYHAGNAGGLDAIDTDLTGANIKYGKTIFGKVGSTNVRDTTDANALVGDVKSPKTFYAGGGAKKTGTMATRTLSPDNDIVLAGYYAATTLHAVDAHLAAGNIKEGITIFGFLGTLVEGTDISDANALVGEVKSGRTFYSVAEPRKTGTMPTKAIVAANDLYEEGYHAGNPGGLDAIDVHLAPANIKKDVNIFGKVGTVEEIPPDLTVAQFQVNPATGTCDNPERLNDGALLDSKYGGADYAEVDLGGTYLLNSFRIHGSAPGYVGYWNIQVYDGSWHDWVINFGPTGDSWSDWEYGPMVVGSKIRISVNHYTDTWTELQELEVKAIWVP